jgi:hypothetical protein
MVLLFIKKFSCFLGYNELKEMMAKMAISSWEERTNRALAKTSCSLP